MPKVTSPVLVIHGTDDDIINISHGLAIYERCPKAVEPLWVEVNINFIDFLQKNKKKMKVSLLERYKSKKMIQQLQNHTFSIFF